MRSEGLFEMNGIKKLNFIEVHTCKKNNSLLINKCDIILFQLLENRKPVNTELNCVFTGFLFSKVTPSISPPDKKLLLNPIQTSISHSVIVL